MNKSEAIDACKNNGFFRHWMPVGQRIALVTALKGEESAGFVRMLSDLKTRIETMPKTGETDDQGDEAIVYLHYFKGSVDAWITEKDIQLPGENGNQIQAFGKICLTGSREDSEWGYISVEELIQNGVELDLYWTPKPLKSVW